MLQIIFDHCLYYLAKTLFLKVVYATYVLKSQSKYSRKKNRGKNKKKRKKKRENYWLWWISRFVIKTDGKQPCYLMFLYNKDLNYQCLLKKVNCCSYYAEWTSHKRELCGSSPIVKKKPSCLKRICLASTRIIEPAFKVNFSVRDLE